MKCVSGSIACVWYPSSRPVLDGRKLVTEPAFPYANVYEETRLAIKQAAKEETKDEIRAKPS